MGMIDSQRTHLLCFSDTYFISKFCVLLNWDEAKIQMVRNNNQCFIMFHTLCTIWISILERSGSQLVEISSEHQLMQALNPMFEG